MFVWGNAVKGDKETMFSDNFYRSLCITSNLTQWKLVNPEPLDEPLEKKNNFSWKIGHMVIKLGWYYTVCPRSFPNENWTSLY